MTLRFRPSFREQLRSAKRGNDFYADMAGKPRLETHPLLEKPVRQYQHNDQRVSEADVNDVIRQYMASREDLVLWRNNMGLATSANGSPVRYGVGPNGASDWIGYRSVTITPDMVGTEIAQFIAVEAKAPDARTPDDAQLRFIGRIRKAGGKAIVVRGRSDLEDL